MWRIVGDWKAGNGAKSRASLMPSFNDVLADGVPLKGPKS
jgi:hypothetical protein